MRHDDTDDDGGSGRHLHGMDDLAMVNKKIKK